MCKRSNRQGCLNKNESTGNTDDYCWPATSRCLSLLGTTIFIYSMGTTPTNASLALWKETVSISSHRLRMTMRFLQVHDLFWYVITTCVSDLCPDTCSSAKMYQTIDSFYPIARLGLGLQTILLLSIIITYALVSLPMLLSWPASHVQNVGYFLGDYPEYLRCRILYPMPTTVKLQQTISKMSVKLDPSTSPPSTNG